MRVVHLINALSIGGAERFLLRLAQAQARRGSEPSILTLIEPNPLEDASAELGIAHQCLGRRRLNDPRLLVDVWRALRELRPDVVHTHLFYADTFGSVAARAAGVRAMVSTQHSTERGGLSWRRRAGMRTMARFADRIVAVSEAVRQSAAALLGLPASAIAVIPNGIALDEWDGARPLPRADLGIPENAFVVGCVGRVVEAKGYDTFLESIAHLANPNVCVLIVGDGPERQRLENDSARLGLRDSVRWLGFRRDVPRILKTLDVFALPSRWEGFSVALLEAMAAGCACLITDIPELVQTVGEGALVVRANDVASIADGLQSLLIDPERRKALREAAKRIANDYSIEKAADRYLRVYEEVVSRKHG